MAKYKVLVIGLSVKNNKVAKFGEIIDESQLCSKPDDLVKEKFISLVDSEVVESKVLETEVKDAEVVESKKPSKK